MIRVKLDWLLSLNKEIQRIESEMEKGKTKHQQDLTWCKQERAKLVSEGLLEQLNLRPIYLEVAKRHYYKGLTWENAYAQVGAKWEDEEEFDKISSIEMRSREKNVTREIKKALNKSTDIFLSNQKDSKEQIVRVTQQSTGEDTTTELMKKIGDKNLQIFRIDK